MQVQIYTLNLIVQTNGQKKLTKRKQPRLIRAALLSYLDSNQDKLIQSQMCYRYTIGQSVFFLSKAGAKVLTFSKPAKLFLK